MARKLIFKRNHLRRMHNEGPLAWKSRKLIVLAYLKAREKWTQCCYRLKQATLAAPTTQIPDFILTCTKGSRWAIEIGITGEKRTRALKRAGYHVLKVGRGQGFNFDKRIRPCKNCPRRKK